MSAWIALVGVKELAYLATAIAGFLALLFVGRTIDNAGANRQKAADAEKGIADNAAATKARSDVDGLADNSVDDRLRKFQRK